MRRSIKIDELLEIVRTCLRGRSRFGMLFYSFHSFIYIDTANQYVMILV